MHNRRVADGDVISDKTRQIPFEMHHGVVLDIGMMADDDSVDISAQDGVEPNTGKLPQGHIPHDYYAFCDIDTLAKARLLVKKFIKLLFDRVHGNGKGYWSLAGATIPGCAGELARSLAIMAGRFSSRE